MRLFSKHCGTCARAEDAILFPLRTTIRALWKRYSGLDSYAGRTSLTVLTFVVAAFLGTVSGLLVARLLGPQGRGELAAMQSWALVLGAVAGLGMSDAVVYFGVRYPSQITTYLLTAYVPVAGSVCLSIALGWWLMPLLLGAQTQEVINAARLLVAVMMPMFGLFIVYESLRAYGAWKAWNVLRIPPNLYWIAILALGFLLPGWANSISLSRLYPLMFLFSVIPALVIVRSRYAHRPFKAKPDYIRPLLGYGIPVMATVLPQTLNFRLDQLVMASVLPAYSLGLYVAAAAWSSAGTPIFAAVSQVLFPRIGSITDRAQQKHIASRSILLYSVLAMLLTGFILLLTPVVFPVLFGAAYRPAIPVAFLLVIAGGFFNISLVLSSVLRGFGRPQNVLFSQVLGLVITVILLYLLLPRYGIMGAGFASLAAYGGVMLASLFFFWRAAFGGRSAGSVADERAL